jgi:UDP-N-acetylmuramoyl-L-alanyl-D-glutamate--2,6-diaminopimelate ligase
MIRAGLTGRIPSRVERDRVAAIEWVAARAGAGDVVLIAGKGHEQYQIYGDERRQFSDRDVVQRIVQRAA